MVREAAVIDFPSAAWLDHGEVRDRQERGLWRALRPGGGADDDDCRETTKRLAEQCIALTAARSANLIGVLQ